MSNCVLRACISQQVKHSRLLQLIRLQSVVLLLRSGFGAVGLAACDEYKRRSNVAFHSAVVGPKTACRPATGRRSVAGVNAGYKQLLQLPVPRRVTADVVGVVTAFANSQRNSRGRVENGRRVSYCDCE